jgi:hypothetical protein
MLFRLLPYPHQIGTIIFPELEQCVHLLRQVLLEDRCKLFHSLKKSVGSEVFGLCLMAIFLESMKPGIELVMLILVSFHQSFLSGVFFDIWKKILFLGMVMVLYQVDQHVAIREQVFDIRGVVNVGSLMVNGIEASDHKVVDMAHLGCNPYGGVILLQVC